MNIIRPATPEDAAATVPLILDAIQDIGYQLTGAATHEEAVERLTYFFTREGNRLSYEHVLVKVLDRQIAGMILCYHGQHAKAIDQPLLDRLHELLPDREAVLDQEADEDEYYIDALAVSPQWKGRGIGTELISAAEQAARQQCYCKIALNVEQSNTRAQALYQRLGYETDKHRTIHGKRYDHMVKML
ncbi:GNAT family N-acetyltransferase [Paenibacillus rigui]|uniref:GNAT family N-acetyltransferase n=1 Tax=Paenibacillus rigui TaxID=554312 RepID=A0A229UJD8_9BACL|nr:GNAT family N-acetyltransferase [Paenibacillus rigui]OXM83578.1 GNAT family N-acetyltransferase [Paenibacillus rigui]